MSNPGVITLAQRKRNLIAKLVNLVRRKNFERFQVEDNVGESIHIHYGRNRIDLTIDEFTKFASDYKEIFDAYLMGIDKSLVNMAPSFLSQLSRHVPYIKEIKSVRIRVRDLKCISILDAAIPRSRVVSISDSFAARYLDGRSNKFISYEQDGPLFQTNVDRLKRIQREIDEHGYPYNGHEIVVFEDMVIRDGQHRAAVLYNQDPDQRIEVKTVVFKRDYKGWRLNRSFIAALLGTIISLALRIRRAIKLVKWFIHGNKFS